MENKNYQWNAAEYAAHSSAQSEWANELIEKLNLKGDEVLLDIGCGDGKVTAAIAEHLPDGHLVGIDSSQEMIDLTSRRYPESDFPNLAFQRTDVREMSFENQFDVVFSNAALHWVKDHVSMLRRIQKSMKKPGKILCQMGGRGNAEDIISVFDELFERKKWRPYFENFIFPYGFYGPDDYEKWLTQAGLQARRVELIPKDMKHKGKEGLAGWIRTTWLPYTERIPGNMRESFISDIIDNYLMSHPIDSQGFTHVRMVRLEVEASALGSD
ncbi:methyltransferase domain-containing protein [Desulfococcaceae bacterium HSG8]|nr:methyltransferase domain-containing protein [Desulfococcaceae bacterium HSG8]